MTPDSALNSQKHLETRLEVRNDLWSAGVSGISLRSGTIRLDLLVEPRPRLLIAVGNPLNEAAHRLSVKTRPRLLLTSREIRDVNQGLVDFQNQHPDPNRVPSWNILASGEDQGSRGPGLSQAGV